jgi:polyisoprenoid-binding protein YceI
LAVRYRVTSGTLTVRARSRIHDTTTVWNRVTGEIIADPDTLAQAPVLAAGPDPAGLAATSARFEVDMTAFDAGDFLKNRKLRKDFALDAHPRASFALTGLKDVVRTGAGFTATAVGTLDWRGKRVELTLSGRGTLDAMGVEASATFELDIRWLGLAAPRFLIFKVEDEVTVDVAIQGVPA